MNYISPSEFWRPKLGLPVLLLLAGSVSSSLSHAAGEITSVVTSKATAIPLQYDIGGQSYSWGEGDDQIIDGFVYKGHTYRYLTVAEDVQLQRVDQPGITSGDPCGVFAERTANGLQSLAPSYPGSITGNGNCDMAAMMAGRVINRGTLDTFSNTGANPKNIERIDFLFPSGIFTPVMPEQLAATGHIVAEKRGNNPVQIAAILALDEDGAPTHYGPLVMVHAHGCSDPQICFGITAEMHDYSFFQSPSHVSPDVTPDGSGTAYASYTGESTEHVGMAFVSVDDLGLRAAQTYYGFSYFPRDVDASLHNLLDPSSYPVDTADDYSTPADGADIYGGVSAYFLLGSSALTTVAVYFDHNGNAVMDVDEAGLADISVNLFIDTNNNGVLDDEDANVGQTLVTGPDGLINIAALPVGNYILQLDETDPDIPAGLELSAGNNPLIFAETGGSQNTLQFTFLASTQLVQNDATDGGTTAGSGAGEEGLATNSDGGSTGAESAGDGSSGGDGTTGGETTAGGTSAGDTTGSGTTDSGASDGANSGGSDGDGSTDSGDAGDGTGADSGNDSGQTAAGDGGTDGSATSGDGSDDSGTSGDGSDDGSTSGGGSDDSGTDDGGTDGSSGSGLPVATPDAEPGRQNQTVTINALANDIDPVGNGLTIISVSSVENGEAQIVGNVIVFEPDYNFLGQENFVYTIEDANGQMASGTVSVTVVLYSDINGNDLNDYEECQCTDLRLITGVDGTGVGSMSLIFLALLTLTTAIVGLSTRRRTATRLAIHGGSDCER